MVKRSFKVLEELEKHKKGNLEHKVVPSLQVLEGLEEFLSLELHLDADKVYKETEKIIKDFTITPEAIQSLTDCITNYSDRPYYHRSGIYYSALINKIATEDSSFSIKVPGESEIGYFGFKQKRGTLYLQGPLGNDIGYCMEGGTITCAYDVRCNTGRMMKDGEIIILGDSNADTGYGMTGGYIQIHGNSGQYTGFRMDGGLIEVLKNSKLNTGIEMKGGGIYVHGNIYGPIGSRKIGGLIKCDGELLQNNGQPHPSNIIAECKKAMERGNE